MMKRKRILKQVVSVVLSASMILSLAACGNSGSTQTTVVENVVETTEQEILSIQSTIDEEKPAEKEKYTDFYMEVNKDWIDAHPLKVGEYGVNSFDDIYEGMLNRFTDILENSSPEDYEEKDPVRKQLLFYQQLKAEGNTREAAMTRLHELVEVIESPKNMDQLYKEVLMNEDLAHFNCLMDMVYTLGSDEHYYIDLGVVPLMDLFMEKTEQEWQIMQDGYANMIETLGYSSETATTMAHNAISVDRKAWDFLCSIDGTSNFFLEDSEELKNCSFPFAKILKAWDYPTIFDDGSEYYCFFAHPDYINFMNDLFVPENLAMLKDYLAVCLIEKMYTFGDANMLDERSHIVCKFMGIQEESFKPKESQFDYYCTTNVLNMDDGALATLYNDKYVTKEIKDDFWAMVNELKAEMLNIVKNADWASEKTKDKLCEKIRCLKFVQGMYNNTDPMDDAQIGETSIDTVLSFMKSHRKYGKRFLSGFGMQFSNNADLYTVNAFYQVDGNAVIICDGFYEYWNNMDENAAYEERLGFIGRTLAHEMAHSIDSNYIYRDNVGMVYADFDDSHWESFYSMITPIHDFFDGKQTALGNQIQANKIYNEAYCDLIALKCCFQLLKSKENTDFDKFFKEYAKVNVENLSTQFDAFRCRRDSHLCGHERINYMTGMFDEFYETYEIDENSPYFVPEKDRIKLY